MGSDLVIAASNSVLAITAIVASFFTWAQIRRNQQSARESTAKDIYKEYLLLAIRYPEISRGIAGDESKADLEKYRWYVSFMMFSCDEILSLYPGDRYWKSTIMTQVRYHSSFLVNNGWWRNHYTEDFVQLVDVAIKANSNSPSDSV